MKSSKSEEKIPVSLALKEWCTWFEERVPLIAAEKWDNVGLIVGHPEWQTSGVVASVDLTAQALQLAQEVGAHLIVLHHPPIFAPAGGLLRVTPSPQADQLSSLIFEAIQKQIGIYCAHTNFDRCVLAAPQKAVQQLGLVWESRLFDRKDPLLQAAPGGITSGVGYGFVGSWTHPLALESACQRVKEAFAVSAAWLTPSQLGLRQEKKIQRVGFVPGKGTAFIASALAQKCDLLISGEIGYHEALEAARKGLAVLELGHRESEVFFLKVIEEWSLELGLSSTIGKQTNQKWV